MDKELRKKFDAAVKPVVELLRTEMHPHASVRICTDGFEVSEGVYANFRMHEEEMIQYNYSKEDNYE